jgi:hypothetical protein
MLVYKVLMSERSPAPLRYATKKVRMISELLIMVQDSIYRQPGLTVDPAKSSLLRVQWHATKGPPLL